MDNSNGAPGANTTPAESARRIKQAATQVLEYGREAAMQRVHESAERARNSARSTCDALRRAADDVHEETPLVSEGLRRAAEVLERTTRQVNGVDLNRAVDGLNDFARRQPVLFLGASLALGFVLARLGKAAIDSGDEALGRPDGPYTPTMGM
jgi:vacuolar-type H+-ATPase subunit H